MSAGAQRGFAVLSDHDGRVLRVLHNAEALAVATGTPLVELFEPGSREKALRLLETVRERAAAYGWELYARRDGGPILVQVSGARVPEGMLLAGAEERPHANALFARLMQERGMAAPAEDAGAMRERLDLYDQLASLNNQLVAMQREVEKKNAALQRLLADRARIAAMAAHDLRNPLQVVRTGALMLERFLEAAPAEARAVLEMMRRNADGMIVLVNDLLAAYSADLGRLELSVRPLDLEALVRANAENNRAVAQQKRIALRFSSGGGVPPVLGDPARLDQMLNNLVHNAIKFSPEGSEIRVGVSAAAEEALIQVEDQGIGLEPETLQALLSGRPAPSAEGTGAEPGFGLGFAIVRTIVEKHRGRIEAASRPGHGARFAVRLPAYRDGV